MLSPRPRAGATDADPTAETVWRRCLLPGHDDGGACHASIRPIPRAWSCRPRAARRSGRADLSDGPAAPSTGLLARRGGRRAGRRPGAELTPPHGCSALCTEKPRWRWLRRQGENEIDAVRAAREELAPSESEGLRAWAGRGVTPWWPGSSAGLVRVAVRKRWLWAIAASSRKILTFRKKVKIGRGRCRADAAGTVVVGYWNIRGRFDRRCYAGWTAATDLARARGLGLAPLIGAVRRRSRGPGGCAARPPAIVPAAIPGSAEYLDLWEPIRPAMRAGRGRLQRTGCESAAADRHGFAGRSR